MSNRLDLFKILKCKGLYNKGKSFCVYDLLLSTHFYSDGDKIILEWFEGYLNLEIDRLVNQVVPF